MDFELSVEQQALRDTVRRFLARQAPLRPYVRSMFDDPRATTDEVWKGLADLGATGLLVPERHGGAGMTLLDMGVVLEELGRMVHPGPFVSSAVAAVSAVVAAGSAEDRAALLPGLADGSTVGTLAVVEPGSRYDWRSPRTRASLTDGGWSVSGSKALVPDAVGADLLVLSARLDDGRLGLFAVDARTDGVAVGPTPTMDPTRAHGWLTLSGARARHLGGEAAPDAAPAFSRLLDRVVVALVTDGLGAASAALELSVAYAKQRVQFGRPIGSFQAVQHLCADMLQLLELGRAGTYYALWAADAADPIEAHRAATMAKAWASDSFARIGASAIQVHGGIGYTWEHDIHLFYKRLLTLQQAYGGTPDHLDELAELVI